MLHAGPHLRRALTSAVLFAATVGACVTTPHDAATGIELTWQFPEANSIDRFRTCTGALVDVIEVTLVDLADSARQRSFRHPCSVGDPSPSERVSTPALIFYDVRPGDYRVAARWFGGGRELGQTAEDVTIEAKSIVPVDLALASPPETWAVELRDPHACRDLSLQLLYSDPSSDLHPPHAISASDYASDRISDQGLPLATTVACSSVVPGIHQFADLERGAYRLRVTIDDVACDADVVLDTPEIFVLDLAKPGCAS